MLCWLIIGVLLWTSGVQAGAPRLFSVAEAGQELVVIEQHLHLWVDASGPWQLTAYCSPGLTVRDGEGRVRSAAVLLEGHGSLDGEFCLELHCQPPFAAGTYEWEFELALQGAGGVVGLKIDGSWWLLPFGSDQLAVDRLGERIEPAPDRWFLVQPEDFVFWRGQRLLLGAEQALDAPKSTDPDLEGPLRPSWLNYHGRQLIRIAEGSGPLLLPDGRLAGDGAAVSVPGGTLDVVLPLHSPHTPIWTGLPFSDAVEWSLEPREDSFASGFVPILLWDQGFTWRIAAWSDPALMHAYPKGVKLSWGPLLLEGLPGGLRASLSVRSHAAEGNWEWQRTSAGYRGSWQEGRWRLTVDLPAQEGQTPACSVQYRSEKLRLQLDPGDLRFQFAEGGWSWGAAAASGTIWLERRDRSFRLALQGERLKADWRPDGQSRFGLLLDPKEVRLEGQLPPWEGYARCSAEGPELGLRFRQAWAKGRWLFASRGAWQLKDGRVLWEVGQTAGYVLSPWCTLYAEGVLGFGPEPAWRAGLGAVFTPKPNLVAAAGWDSQRGLHWKAGIVLPLGGRETPR